MTSELKIFSGSGNPRLARAICDYLRLRLGNLQLTRFSDGELYCQVLENVRGTDVFVIQPTCPPVNENLMELLIVVDSLKRSSAARISRDACVHMRIAKVDLAWKGTICIRRIRSPFQDIPMNSCAVLRVDR